MEEQFEMMNIPIILTALALVVGSLIFLCLINPNKLSRTKCPPSPYKLPIIGNLHQLGPLAHQDLHSLSKTHGPLMLLHLGSVPVLVVSSSDLAREITRNHDVTFSNRPAFKAFKKLSYGCKDVSLPPYGDYWRQVRSIVVLQLLSSKRVQSFRTIREEETALFLDKVRESPGAAVDLSAMFAGFTNDGIGRAAFGRKHGGSETGKRFLVAMKDLMVLASFVNIGDFIPWLDWIGRVNGYYKRLDESAEVLDRLVEALIEERQGRKNNGQGEGEGEGEGEDFLDILLQNYNGTTQTVDGASIGRDSVKAALLDIYVAGTDTISTAMEWAMSELLRHPTSMEKLQQEVRGIVKGREEIRDDDLEKMHYLKAVIKETLRMHPPFPLLAPRISTQDVRINGFEISAGTVLMINAWGMGRDPISWDKPEKFMPERFLNSSIDYRGQDFELIPFGSGRRGCPGIAFASATMEYLLANIVQKFDWKLANGVQGEDLDMKECPGLTARRAVPLLAVASPHIE